MYPSSLRPQIRPRCDALLGLLIALFCFSTTSDAQTFTNPLKPNNGADPSLLYTTEFGGWYYLVNTGNNGVMEMMRGQTLEGLKNSERKTLLNYQKGVGRREEDLWAPEIHQLNGTWYLYYTAKDRKVPPNAPGGTDYLRPHVATGFPLAWDGFQNFQMLDMDQDVWGIDGSLIHFPNDPEQQYFIWSCLDQVDHGTQNICIARMRDPLTVVGPRTIISAPTYDWEKFGSPTNEGPHALYHKDKVWITYSASQCNTPSYVLGLLTWNGGDPLKQESWVKKDRPVLQQDGGNFGTGHNGFFRSPDGSEVSCVFHAQNKYPTPNGQACGGERYTMVSGPIVFDENDGPQIPQPSPLNTPLKVPSGEGKQGMVANPEPPQN